MWALGLRSVSVSGHRNPCLHDPPTLTSRVSPLAPKTITYCASSAAPESSRGPGCIPKSRGSWKVGLSREEGRRGLSRGKESVLRGHVPRRSIRYGCRGVSSVEACRPSRRAVRRGVSSWSNLPTRVPFRRYETETSVRSEFRWGPGWTETTPLSGPPSSRGRDKGTR